MSTKKHALKRKLTKQQLDQKIKLTKQYYRTSSLGASLEQALVEISGNNPEIDEETRESIMGIFDNVLQNNFQSLEHRMDLSGKLKIYNGFDGLWTLRIKDPSFVAPGKNHLEADLLDITASDMEIPVKKPLPTLDESDSNSTSES